MSLSPSSLSLSASFALCILSLSLSLSLHPWLSPYSLALSPHRTRQTVTRCITCIHLPSCIFTHETQKFNPSFIPNHSFMHATRPVMNSFPLFSSFLCSGSFSLSLSLSVSCICACRFDPSGIRTTRLPVFSPRQGFYFASLSLSLFPRLAISLIYATFHFHERLMSLFASLYPTEWHIQRQALTATTFANITHTDTQTYRYSHTHNRASLTLALTSQNVYTNQVTSGSCLLSLCHQSPQVHLLLSLLNPSLAVEVIQWKYYPSLSLSLAFFAVLLSIFLLTDSIMHCNLQNREMHLCVCKHELQEMGKTWGVREPKERERERERESRPLCEFSVNAWKGKSDTLGNLCIYIGVKNKQKKKSGSLKKRAKRGGVNSSSKEPFARVRKKRVKWPVSLQELRSQLRQE